MTQRKNHKTTKTVVPAQPSRPAEAEKMQGAAKESKKAWRKLLSWVLLHGLGVIFTFYIVQYGVSFLLYLIYGEEKLITLSNDPVFVTLVSAVVYSLILALVLVVPKKLFKQKLTREELGLIGLPTWMDILLSPTAFVVYLIGASILTYIVSAVFPGFDVNQAQDVGYTAENLVSQLDYLLAFLALVVVAPVAEEIIFRGYLYGKLRSKLTSRYGIAISMVVVSALFGLAHGQWNVGVNVFVMSLVMCGLREITGSVWSGVLLHMLKNGIAYYFLFVNPSAMNSIIGN
ncbi:MAG: CPBP family intramembrane metalloprotease [Candidatus Nomurabacteria bacterium]|jgi:membrane protease YdiL (CAAX protease family)|nr:CPBP family intramembrane metalloprotease [Candidatus Nomurabacteria bacterium]